MATARLTVGSVFDSVVGLATMVTKTVNTGSSGIDMMQRFVDNAAIDQRERHVAHRATFRDRLIREASYEIAKGDLEALTFCNESEEHKNAYLKSQDMLTKAFETYDSAKN